MFVATDAPKALSKIEVGAPVAGRPYLDLSLVSFHLLLRARPSGPAPPPTRQPDPFAISTAGSGFSSSFDLTRAGRPA